MAATITQFTPPASCSTPWFGTRPGATGYALLNGVKCSKNAIFDDEDCSPPTAPAYPGCPFNWSGGLTKSSTIACCPNGFSLTRMDDVCVTRFAGPVVEVVFCDANSPSSTVMHTFEFSDPAIFVQNVKFISTQESSSVVSSTPTPTPASTTFTTPTSTDSPTPTSSPISQGSKDVLSGATIAGIVVGAIASAVLIVAGILLLERQKRRRVREITPAGYFGSKAELPISGEGFGEIAGTNAPGYRTEALARASPVELRSDFAQGHESRR